MTELDRAALVTLCERARRGAGAREQQATALAEATAQAELRGRRAVGVTHLLDYLDAFRAERIATRREPSVQERTPVVIAVDSHGGLAQESFLAARSRLTSAAESLGLAALAVGDCFTVGELDHYVRPLNAAGLIGLAVANSPALMSIAGSRAPILGTNPLAFGVPLPGGGRLAFDQAASATAWVSVRTAATRGEALPPGWAIGPDGEPTSSPQTALAGALLPFGGYKGGNIALMVEVLATLAGGRFSRTAPSFLEGERTPGVGMLVLAISPEVLGADYPERLEIEVAEWREQGGAAVEVWASREEARRCSIPDELHETLMAWADPR